MEPGSRIEHYVIIEKIGQGGQAAVWSALDERLKRTVAIKTINLAQDGEGSSETEPASQSNLTTPDQFREEAEIIAALEHPNILPVYGFGQAGDSLYIVMRYMAAGSLRDLLRREKLLPHQVLDLIEPLAGALDLAHENHIIHRDLKSANVLLDAHLHPYLADFGLSMTMGGKNSAAGVGTLAYMSPEQMLGDPLDHHSDLYSFGILTAELFTGSIPNIEGQPWNLQQVMSGVPLPIPDDMDLAIADILRRATALKPEYRYNSAAEMTAALRDAIAGQTVLELPLPPVITDPAQLALMEAHDLFQRALDRWSDGAGRFRLEAGDFKYIDGFYRDAQHWNLVLDTISRRLMLRGAVEHGVNLDTWWEQLPDVADRRAVALQALTSDLAPARQRAMSLLTDIEDADPPAIPIRVATILQTEIDPDVKLTGIAVLEKRATPAPQWRPYAYNEPIDTVLADLAADDPDPRVAAAAARAAARLRSRAAILTLSQRAADDAGQFDLGAFAALVNARDEGAALPPEIPMALRARVFAELSRRQLFADPLSLIWRYAAGVVAFAVALGVVVYALFDDPNGVLASQRIGTALAVGVLYGVLLGVGLLAATEPAQRLRAWTPAGRIAVAWLLGTVGLAIGFTALRRFFYGGLVPDWLWIVLVSAIFAAGFAIASGLTRRPAIRSAAGTVSTLIAIYLVSWQIGFLQQARDPLVAFSDVDDDLTAVLAIFFAVAVGLLAFLPEWIAALRRLTTSQD